MVEQAKSDMGRIDILINSAGGCILKFLPEMDDDSWDKVINMNLTRSTFIVTREVCNRAMIPQHYGKIINLVHEERSGHRPDRPFCIRRIQGSGQHADEAACMRTGSVRHHRQCPGSHVYQDGYHATLLEDPNFRDPLIRRIPVGRIGEFKDMMGLMLLCASDASEFLTGQTYLIDGGIASRQE